VPVTGCNVYASDRNKIIGFKGLLKSFFRTHVQICLCPAEACLQHDSHIEADKVGQAMTIAFII